MSRRRLILIVVGITVLVALIGGAVWGWLALGGGRADYVSKPTTERLSGPSPIDTAIMLSREGWKSADSVVLIAEDEAAAAVASPLAFSAKGAVLLTERGSLPERVAARIKELAPKTIYLVGKTDSFAPAVLESAKALAPTEVLGGADDFAMADAVATKMTSLGATSDVAVIPQAKPELGVVVSGFAAAAGMPIVFADEKGAVRISPANSAALSGGRALIAAGAETVSDDALTVAGLKPKLIDRVTAPDVQQFASEFARYAFAHGFEYSTVFAARSVDIAHAYALGALAAQPGLLSPIVVTDEDALGTVAERFFVDHASAIKVVRFLGSGGEVAKAVEKATLEAATTKISRDAVVIEGELASRLSEYETGTVTFDRSAAVQQRVKKGRVLVSAPTGLASRGFLVAVESVQMDGDKMVAKVRQASLDEIVIKGSLDGRMASRDASSSTTGAVVTPRGIIPATYRGQPRLGSPTRRPTIIRVADRLGERSTAIGRTIDTFKYDFIGQRVESSVGEESAFLEVDATADVTLTNVVSATWEAVKSGPILEVFGIQTKGRLTRFSITTTTAIRRDLALKVGYKKTFLKYQAPFAKSSVLLATAVFAIAEVPVTLDLKYKPIAEVAFSVAGSVQYANTQLVSSSMGVRYASDDPVRTTYFANRRVGPEEWSLSFAGTLGGTAAVGCRLEILVYGIAGPFAQLEGYASLSGEAELVKVGSEDGSKAGFQNPDLKGKAVMGIKPSWGGTLEIFGKTVADPLKFSPSDRWLKDHGLEWTLWDPNVTLPILPKPDTSRQTYDMAVVVDNSGSMGFEVGDGVKRIDNAKEAVKGMLDVVSEPAAGVTNLVSLSSFAGEVGENEPLTNNYDMIAEAAERLHGDGSNGTSFENGINAGIDHVQTGGAQKRVMVLISDGSPNQGASSFEELSAPDGVLQRAKSSDIAIWTIGYGSQGGGDYNPELLRQIARFTGGEAFIEEPAKDVGNSLALRLVGIGEKAAGGTIIAEKSLGLDRGEPAKLTSFTLAEQQAGKIVDARVMVGARDRGTDIWLVDPDGVEVSKGSYPDVSISEGRALKRFTIPNAKAGEYQVFATAPQEAVASAERGAQDAPSSGEKSVGATDESTDQSGSGSSFGATTNTSAESEETSPTQAGCYVLVSETPAQGTARATEEPARDPVGVVPPWFWAGVGIVGLLLLGLFVISLVVRR